MHDRYVRILGALAVVALCLTSVPIASQAPAGPVKSAQASALPRTPDGHPDLAGDYLTATITPLERPEAFGNKLMLTEKEAAELEEQSLARNQVRNAPSRAERTAPRVQAVANLT